MPPTIESLGLTFLTRDERITLAHDLWDSIAAQAPPQLSNAQMRELDRRIVEDDNDPDGGIPWEDVQARLKAKYGI